MHDEGKANGKVVRTVKSRNGDYSHENSGRGLMMASRKSRCAFRCIRRETFQHEICQTCQAEVSARFQKSPWSIGPSLSHFHSGFSDMTFRCWMAKIRKQLYRRREERGDCESRLTIDPWNLAFTILVFVIFWSLTTHWIF